MKTFLKVIAGLIIFLGVMIIMAIPTYFLWNWLMPVLFNLPFITIWQAIGINLLSGILFGRYIINDK